MEPLRLPAEAARHVLPASFALLAVALLLGAGILVAGLGGPSGPHFASLNEDEGSFPAQEVAPEEAPRLPLAFTPNLGQAPTDARFYANAEGFLLSLHPDRIELAAPGSPPVTVTFPGAEPSPVLVGEGRRAGVMNFLAGDDPAGWVRDVPTYDRVRYSGLLDGTDLVFYADAEGGLEFDFILAPGAEPHRIALLVEGAAVEPAEGGGLSLVGEGGAYTLQAPVAYQDLPSGRVAVASRFEAEGSRIAFAVGAYDRSAPLTIDPKLSYATYVGGDYYEVLTGVATNPADPPGIVYASGYAQNFWCLVYTSLPWTSGSYEAPFGPFGGSCHDAWVGKFDTTQGGAASLVWATYISGNAVDVANDVAVDGTGVYVTGYTSSRNTPTGGWYTTPNAFQPAMAGTTGDTSPPASHQEAFLVKLNPSGSAVLYSSYLGGGGIDNAFGIAVDGTGRAAVVGDTPLPPSTNPTLFPTKNAFQATMTGTAADAFVSVFDTNAPTGPESLVFSTLLGGDAADRARAVAFTPTGQVAVAGHTSSVTVPFPTTASAFMPVTGGGVDGFVTVLTPDGSALAYSTHLGGTSTDELWDVDASGTKVAVTGYTISSVGYPTTPGAYDTSYLSTEAIVAVFDVALSGTASLLASTFLGGANFSADYGHGVRILPGGDVVVSGQTSDSTFPKVNQHPSLSSTGGSDFFVTRLNPTLGSPLVYSMKFGGTSTDQSHFNVNQVAAIDGTGAVYVVGMTWSWAGFPATAAGPALPPPAITTKAAYDNSYGTPWCMGCYYDGALMRVVKSEPYVTCSASAPQYRGSPVTLSTTGTVGVDAPLKPTSDPLSYQWDLNYDGTFDPAPGLNGQTGPVPTFWTLGPRTVRVQVMDQDGYVGVAECLLNVQNNKPVPGFSTAPSPACATKPLTLDGSLSSDLDGTVASYAWSMPGGSPSSQPAGSSPVAVTTYSTTGTKFVSLTVVDNDGGSSSAVYPVTVVSILPATADFDVAAAPPFFSGMPIGFVDGSAGGCGPIVSWQWDFDYDGYTPTWDSTVPNPVETYWAPGTYTVLLKVVDAAGQTATAQRDVEVVMAEPPTADFAILSAKPHWPGKAVVLQDQSVAGTVPIVDWLWDIESDGVVDLTGVPPPSFSYPALGTYTVTLTVVDQFGNSDTDWQDIDVVTQPVAPPPDAGDLARAVAGPTAAFVATPEPASPGELVRFEDASVPGDAAIAFWDWDLGEAGAAASDRNAAHRYESIGIYTVRLTVTDTQGLSDTAVQQVEVRLPNAAPSAGSGLPAPVANAGDDQVVLAGAPVALDGSLSTGSRGLPLGYAWEQVGGPTVDLAGDDAATPTFTAPAVEGAQEWLTFQLVVAEDGIASAPDTVQVAVQALPVPPVAAFRHLVIQDGTVQFEERSSGAGALELRWDFGDGATSSDADPRHTFASSGTYVVRLTVRDPYGAEATSEAVLAVVVPMAQPLGSERSDARGDALVPRSVWLPAVATLVALGVLAAGMAWLVRRSRA